MGKDPLSSSFLKSLELLYLLREDVVNKYVPISERGEILILLMVRYVTVELSEHHKVIHNSFFLSINMIYIKTAIFLHQIFLNRTSLQQLLP